MIDGYIIAKMTAIPVSVIPEQGAQIKFVDLFQKITCQSLPYPEVNF